MRCGGILVTPVKVLTADHCFWVAKKENYALTEDIGEIRNNVSIIRISTICYTILAWALNTCCFYLYIKHYVSQSQCALFGLELNVLAGFNITVCSFNPVKKYPLISQARNNLMIYNLSHLFSCACSWRIYKITHKLTHSQTHSLKNSHTLSKISSFSAASWQILTKIKEMVYHQLF